jgi:hypothetical protein
VRNDCQGTPVIEEIVRGILTVTCPECGMQYSTPKT